MHTDFQKTADDIMLRNYMPPGVIINELMDIVQFRGSTSNYLEQAHGKPSHNLLKMAKNGLAFELRNILLKAKKENAASAPRTREIKNLVISGRNLQCVTPQLAFIGYLGFGQRTYCPIYQ